MNVNDSEIINTTFFYCVYSNVQLSSHRSNKILETDNGNNTICCCCSCC